MLSNLIAIHEYWKAGLGLENLQATELRNAKSSVFILERVMTLCDKKFWWSLYFNVVPSFRSRVTPVSLDFEKFLG